MLFEKFYVYLGHLSFSLKSILVLSKSQGFQHNQNFYMIFYYKYTMLIRQILLLEQYFPCLHIN